MDAALICWHALRSFQKKGVIGCWLPIPLTNTNFSLSPAIFHRVFLRHPWKYFWKRSIWETRDLCCPIIELRLPQRNWGSGRKPPAKGCCVFRSVRKEQLGLGWGDSLCSTVPPFAAETILASTLGQHALNWVPGWDLWMCLGKKTPIFSLRHADIFIQGKIFAGTIFFPLSPKHPEISTWSWAA